MNNKALGAIVSSILLLGMTIIAVISFQSWFTTYQSSSYVEIEETIDKSMSIQIEDIVDDSLFISTSNPLRISKVEIGGIDCQVNEIINNMEPINISSCLRLLTTQTPEILVVSNNQVLTKSIFYKDIFECDPLCSQNIIYDNYNELMWTRNLTLVGIQRWSESNYPQPLWNESSSSYIWPTGRDEDDYPTFKKCSNLELDNHDDWRLPTLSEIQNLGEYVTGWSKENFSNYGFLSLGGGVPLLVNESSASSTFVVTYDGSLTSISKMSFGPAFCVRS